MTAKKEWQYVEVHAALAVQNALNENLVLPMQAILKADRSPLRPKPAKYAQNQNYVATKMQIWHLLKRPVLDLKLDF